MPTIAESGYPEFDVDSYIILAAPARIPEPIAAKLEAEVQRAVKLPAFAKRFHPRDIISVGSSGAEVKAWIGRELPRWAKVIKAAKMQVN